VRLLVTGGSGFIGTNLVEFHARNGNDVLSLDIRPPRNPAHESHWRRVNLLDQRALRDEFDRFRPTHLLHMGARTDLHGESQADYAANLTGLSHVIDAAAVSTSLERAIFASSRMVCRIDHRPVGDEDYSPPNTYGESKMLGEQMVRRSELSVPWTIVRPTSIWGPWFDIPYKTFFLTIAKGRYVHVKGLDIAKSFGYVGNTVHELDRIAAAPLEQVRGRTFYLGDYPPIDVRDMAERIRRETEAPRIRTLPMPLLRIAGRGGDLARSLGWREPPLTSFRLSNLTTDMVYDLTSLESVVGPLPFSLEEGIRTTVRWMRAAGEI
jgi:nucleoside-diphosphate-sugar epimerase